MTTIRTLLFTIFLATVVLAGCGNTNTPSTPSSIPTVTGLPAGEPTMPPNVREEGYPAPSEILVPTIDPSSYPAPVDPGAYPAP